MPEEVSTYQGDIQGWMASEGGMLLCVPFLCMGLCKFKQEGHPACKKTGCWFVDGDDLTGTLHDL